MFSFDQNTILPFPLKFILMVEVITKNNNAIISISDLQDVNLQCVCENCDASEPLEYVWYFKKTQKMLVTGETLPAVEFDPVSEGKVEGMDR